MTVALLKDAIKAKKTMLFQAIEADKLELFVAMTATSWLSAGGDDVQRLARGETTATIAQLISKDKKLQPLETLENVLNGKSPPPSRHIHLLVVAPRGTGDYVSSQSVFPILTMLCETVDNLSDIVALGKRKRFVHSAMDSARGKELLDGLNLRIEDVCTIENGGMTAIEPFDWEAVPLQSGEAPKLSEEQQREQYRAYIEQHIRDALAANRLTLIGVEQRDLLSVQVKGTEIELVGGTDLLILSDMVDDNPFDIPFFPEVKMLIEVKRDMDESAVYQAVSELIALDLRAENEVAALVTDLNGVWIFLWVSDKKKNDCGRIHKATIKKPGEAFHVIRQIIATSEAELSLSCLEMPMKRQKLPLVCK